MSVDVDDPEPLVLGLTAEQMPPLVQVRRWTATALADVDDEHPKTSLGFTLSILRPPKASTARAQWTPYFCS
jgi:hypothetical protein